MIDLGSDEETVVGTVSVNGTDSSLELVSVTDVSVKLVKLDTGRCRLLALLVCEETSGDDDANREALCPHTGLNNLLGCRLVPIIKGEHDA